MEFMNSNVWANASVSLSRTVSSPVVSGTIPYYLGISFIFACFIVVDIKILDTKVPVPSMNNEVVSIQLTDNNSKVVHYESELDLRLIKTIPVPFKQVSTFLLIQGNFEEIRPGYCPISYY